MSTEIQEGVTEVGEFLASIATSIPEKSRRELVRLLGHSVAAPSMAELREARLGLLVEMVDAGEIPKADDYTRLRKTRAARGENWPSHASLILHFGTWANAAKAALDVCFSVTSKRDWARQPREWPLVPFKRPEIVEALEDSSEKVGRRITQWEYVELRRVERRLASQMGLPDPRLPHLGVIRKNFGDWEKAISKVKYEESHE